MISDHNIRNAVQDACASIVAIQETLLESAKNASKLDEVTAWQNAETLFQLAKEVDGFKRRLANLLVDNPPTPFTQPPKTFEINQRKRHSISNTKDMAPKKNRNDYPKYLISDDCLLKIGLQRDRQTEYQHIVQKAAFDKIASVIGSQLDKTKEFTAENIQSHLNLPVYQTYVVLAMFRQMGLLKIPRRGMYTATNVNDFVAVAADVWRKLPTAGETQE